MSDWKPLEDNNGWKPLSSTEESEWKPLEAAPAENPGFFKGIGNELVNEVSSLGKASTYKNMASQAVQETLGTLGTAADFVIGGGTQIAGGVLNVFGTYGEKILKDPGYAIGAMGNWMMRLGKGDPEAWNPEMSKMREVFGQGEQYGSAYNPTAALPALQDYVFGSKGTEDWIHSSSIYKGGALALERVDKYNQWFANLFSDKPDLVNTVALTIANLAELKILHETFKLKAQDTLGKQDAPEVKAHASLDAIEQKAAEPPTPTEPTEPAVQKPRFKLLNPQEGDTKPRFKPVSQEEPTVPEEAGKTDPTTSLLPWEATAEEGKIEPTLKEEPTVPTSVEPKVGESLLRSVSFDTRGPEQFVSDLARDGIEDLTPMQERIARLPHSEDRFDMHPLMKWVADQIDLSSKALKTAQEQFLYNPVFQRAWMAISNLGKETHMVPGEGGMFSTLSQLSWKDQARVFSHLVEGEKLSKEFDNVELTTRETNPLVRKAYNEIRAKINELGDMLNQRLVREKKQPLQLPVGYIPHEWIGNFRVHFFDQAGERVHTAAFSTRWGAQRAMKTLKNDPALQQYRMEYQEKRPVETRGNVLDSAAVKNASFIENIAKSNPAMVELKEAIRKATSVQGFAKHLQQRHYNPVGGWEGSDGFTSKRDVTKFKDILEGYTRRSLGWLHNSDLQSKLAQVMSDPYVADKLPRARETAMNDYSAYSKQDKFLDYGFKWFSHNMGLPENTLGTGIVGLANKVLANQALLWFRAQFIAAQVLQGHVVPARLAELQSMGFKGSVIKSAAVGTADIYRSLTPDKIKALQYAAENHFLASQVKEMMAWHLKGVQHRLDLATGASIAGAADSFSRLHAFLQFYDFFKDSGMNLKDAATAASKETSRIMIDYAGWKKSQIFNSLGTVGDALSMLSTYTVNETGKVLRYVSEAGKGTYKLDIGLVKPLMMFLAAKWVVAGMQGMPFYQDANNLWGYVRHKMGYAPHEAPTPQEWLVTHGMHHPLADDMLQYGIPSATLNSNMWHSMGSNPLWGSVGVAPGVTNAFTAMKEAADVVGQSLDAAAGLTTSPNGRDLGRAANAFTPSPLRPYVQNMATNPNHSPFSHEGDLLHNLKSGEGTIKLNASDAAYRNLFLGNTLNVDKQQSAQYNFNSRQSEIKGLDKSIGDRLVRGVAEKTLSPQEITTMAQRYSSLFGPEKWNSLVSDNHLEDMAQKLNLPFETRVKLNALKANKETPADTANLQQFLQERRTVR